MLAPPLKLFGGPGPPLPMPMICQNKNLPRCLYKNCHILLLPNISVLQYVILWKIKKKNSCMFRSSLDNWLFQSTKAFPMKSPRSPLDTSDYLAKGVSSPNRDPPSVLSARSMALKSRKHFPRKSWKI